MLLESESMDRMGSDHKGGEMAPRSEPQVALGQAIREARIARGLSQEEVAHKAELHPTWLSHIEAGGTRRGARSGVSPPDWGWRSLS